MSFAAYIPLAGCIFNALFALYFFSRSPRSKSNQVFLLSGISIAVWNFGSFQLFVVGDPWKALFWTHFLPFGGLYEALFFVADAEKILKAQYWARFLEFGVLFEVVAFIHLSLLVAGIRVGKWIRWLYVFQTGLAAVNFTPYYISGVKYLGTSGWYGQAGQAFPLLNVSYTLSFISIVILWRKRESLPKLQRRRVTSLIFAQSMLALVGINDLLPIMWGTDFYPFTRSYVYPWGSLAAVFYGLILSYSVLQNQLLDIRIGLSRFAAHFIRFSFLFGITLALLLGVERQRIFPTEFTHRSFAWALGVFIVSTIIAAVLFPRIFGGKALEKWEHRILGDRFEYQDQVRNFIESMVWYNDLNTLLNDLNELLLRTFRIESYRLILRDETTRMFTIQRAHPEESARELSEFKSHSPLFQYFDWRNAEYLSLNPAYSRLGESALERQARAQLSGFGAEFCLPLVSDNDQFGLLLVGRKEQADPYTANDLNLLVALVKNMSLMVNQIRLKAQILQSQELDLLGKMSRGMAHDLNNLLTPVWTLLQISMESGHTQPLDEELLPIAQRNVRTMLAYIKEALFFSENLRPDLQLGRLDLVVRQAADVASASRKKDVALAVSTPSEELVEMDEVLIQRLIANLISNAIDASRLGTQVRVELERLAKTEASRDWVRVRVIDQGEGIPKENLTRILTPYFTTKNRGDENRGFGLGLAICRKIVNLHGGHLSIASQQKKGTTVQVDLPSRQLKQVLPPMATSA